MQHAAVAVIFAITVVGLYARPRSVRDWHVALAGAVAAWLVGPLSFHDGLLVIRHSWNIVAFFSGLMLLGSGAEAAGLYARVAEALRRTPAGRPRVFRTLLTGAGITAILSNDATPLILTPAVFVAAPSVAAATDAAFATTFIADSASLLLPISNPVNLLFYDRFDLSLRWYAVHILPAAIVAVVAVVALSAVLISRSQGDDTAGDPPVTIQGHHRGFERFAIVTFLALASPTSPAPSSKSHWGSSRSPAG